MTPPYPAATAISQRAAPARDAGRARGRGRPRRHPRVSAPNPYPNVLRPIELGPVELRNRVISTSHQTSLVHDHVPTEDLVAYQEARARGGVGAIFLEATAVHPTGLLTAHTIGGYLPEIVPAYRRLGDTVRAHGARLFLQLFHGGREQISSAPRAPAVAPSAVPTQRFHVEPRALSQAEIRELIDGFRACAVRAREGGVDGIELSAAHAYLAAQFFAPRSNHRDDGYNGALDARAALLPARCWRRSARAPGPTSRSACACPPTRRRSPGLDADACAEIAARAERPTAWSTSWTPRSATPPPTPAASGSCRRRRPAATPSPRRWQKLRAALPPGLPLLATTRVVDLADAERIVADGTADLVGMTRALIADPELVAKALRGAEDETILCIGCNQGCIGHYHAGLPIACTVNLSTGREGSPRRRRDRPAGRWSSAAGRPASRRRCAAAQAGDEVALVERDEAVGGQLRLAGHVPAHAETWARYRRLAERDLQRAGVELRLGEEATAATARRLRPRRRRDRRATVPAAAARPALSRRRRLDGDPRARLRRRARCWSPTGAASGAGLDAAEARRAPRARRSSSRPRAIVAGETSTSTSATSTSRASTCSACACGPHLELAVVDGEAVLRHVFSGRTGAARRHRDARRRAGPPARGRALAGARGPAGRGAGGRRARPALHRGGHPGGRGRGRLSEGPAAQRIAEDDLAEAVGARPCARAPRGRLERQHDVDRRPPARLLAWAQQGRELARAAHRRAVDRELAEEHAADVDRGASPAVSPKLTSVPPSRSAVQRARPGRRRRPSRRRRRRRRRQLRICAGHSGSRQSAPPDAPSSFGARELLGARASSPAPRAPSACAICTRNVATPPPAPVTSTVAPSPHAAARDERAPGREARQRQRGRPPPTTGRAAAGRRTRPAPPRARRGCPGAARRGSRSPAPGASSRSPQPVAGSSDHVVADRVAVDALADRSATTPAASEPRMNGRSTRAGLRRIQTSRRFRARAHDLDQHLAGAGLAGRATRRARWPPGRRGSGGSRRASRA